MENKRTIYLPEETRKQKALALETLEKRQEEISEMQLEIAEKEDVVIRQLWQEAKDTMEFRDHFYFRRASIMAVVKEQFRMEKKRNAVNDRIRLVEEILTKLYEEKEHNVLVIRSLRYQLGLE